MSTNVAQWVEVSRRLMEGSVTVFAPTSHRGQYHPYLAAQYMVTERRDGAETWEVRERIVDGEPFYMSDLATSDVVRLAHAVLAPAVDVVVRAERNRGMS